MGRYIDADALIQLGLQDGAYEYVSVQEIAEFPTADVAPMVHGKWKNGDCICPVCGEDKFKGLDADIWSDWKPNYCPNCGAKMDGENGTKN